MTKFDKTKIASLVSLLLLNHGICHADILANELVKLKLDENSGTLAVDASGNHNDATLKGAASWKIGKSGSAIAFDGINSHADLKNNKNSALHTMHQQNFAIAAWIKPTQALDHRSGLINRWGVHEGLFFTEQQKFVFFHRLPNKKTIKVTSSQSYAPGDFQHVAVSVDGANGELAMYINGKLDSKLSYTPAQSDTSFGRPWRLGVKNPDAATPAARENFAGIIDEVQFFDNSLSASEAKEVWEQHAKLTSLVNLKLDENTGLVAYDDSGKRNDADLYGASWTKARNDSGLSFDGTDDYVDINNVEGSALDLLNQKDHTISAWVKPTAEQSHRSGIITRWSVHQGLFYKADKHFEFKHRTASGTQTVTSNIAYEPGQFYYVTVSVNSTEGSMKLYVNGQLAGSRSYTPGDHSTINFNRPWRLGVKNIDANTAAKRENFAGILDEVQFLQGAASPQQATELWQQQLSHCSLGAEAGSGTGSSPTLLTNNDFVSFEQFEVPQEWRAEKGKLAINSERAKNGSSSLEWDWVAGDHITVSDIQSQGLKPNEIDRTNYYQSTFRIWLYNEEALDDQLQVEFYDNKGNLQYSYPINLNFTGWRPASVKYRTDMSGNKASQDLTKMKIKAPASACSGKLLIDLVDFTAPKTLIQGGDYQVPMATTGFRNHWTDMLVFEKYPEGPKVTATSAQIAETAQMKKDYRENVLKAERKRKTGIVTLADAISKYNQLGITVNGDKVTATVPLFGPRHIHKDFGIKSDVLDSYIMVFAREYLDNNDQLAKEYFVNLVRYMLDQGFAAGSMLENMSHIGYHARGINDAILLMEEPLKQAGLWQQAFDAVAWYNTLEQIWQPVSDNVSNIDHAKTRVGYILGIILHINDANTRVQYLNGYKQHLETWLTHYSRGRSGLKPDYSGFHHSTHYPGYVYGAINSFTKVVDNIAGSSFAISQDKLNFLIKLVQGINVQHANRDMPISLSGRNPFSVPTIGSSLINLARTTGDNRFYQAYNRLFKANDTTRNAGKEGNPQGFWQFNYRPMGTYREDNWVANIRGLNKYFWGSEIYKDANRFGRYQSYGSIIINYQLPDDQHTSSVSVKGSTGFTEAGWDWNKIPGTTTKHLSWSDLVAAKPRQDEWNDKAFAGALRFGEQNDALVYVDKNIEGQCGIYGLDFQQRAGWSPTHDGSFTFKKSMFACEGMIIALGSDINSTDSQNIIATNLFQQSVIDAPQNLVENGVDKTGNSYSNTITRDRNWLIDLYGTGYYIKQGGNVEVRIQDQDSPNQKYNDVTKLSHGNFASAWIDHGAAPNNGRYEYAIVPNTTKQDMFRLAMEMQMQLSYRVLQQNSDAHIVSFANSTKEGYVIFNPSNNLAGRYVAGADTPVLVMAEQQGSKMKLSLSNPDHNFTGKAPRYGDSQPMTVTVTLKGKWSLDQPVSGVTNFGIVADNTEFTVTTVDGKAYDLALSQLN